MKTITTTLVLVCVMLSGIAAADYTVVHPEAITGNYYGQMFDINDAGQITGHSNLDAFRWDPVDGLQNISNVDPYTYGWSISSDGRVAGQVHVSSSVPNRAFYWDSDTPMSILPDTEQSECQYSHVAQGVNSSGQVVGARSVSPGSSAFNAYVWSAEDGTSLNLGTLGGTTSRAHDINDAGQVVGAADTLTESHAFLWDADTGMIDLGTLWGNSEAVGISDNGLVAGTCYDDFDNRAFLWDEANGMRDLGLLDGATGSIAVDVNTRGEVIGYSYRGEEGYQGGAFLWTEERGLENLNDLIDPALEIDLFATIAINNHGDILAWGFGTDGEHPVHPHTYLLLADRVVPEPASLTLMGMGLSALAVARLRRKRS